MAAANGEMDTPLCNVCTEQLYLLKPQRRIQLLRAGPALLVSSLIISPATARTEPEEPRPPTPTRAHCCRTVGLQRHSGRRGRALVSSSLSPLATGPSDSPGRLNTPDSTIDRRTSDARRRRPLPNSAGATADEPGSGTAGVDLELATVGTPEAARATVDGVAAMAAAAMWDNPDGLGDGVAGRSTEEELTTGAADIAAQTRSFSRRCASSTGIQSKTPSSTSLPVPVLRVPRAGDAFKVKKEES
ncbi:hypothetical protein HK405_003597, partial [Cladochytrium tenue]